MPDTSTTPNTRPGLESKVLITGASGFLGSYLVDSYVARRIPVRALVRSSSDLSYLETHVQAGQVELAYGSMTDQQSLCQAVAGASHIVHAAAIIGRPGTPQALYDQVNIEGTRVLIQAALAEGMRRFTLISSVSTYGNAALSGGPVTETTPKHPSNPYGKSKLAQEELAFAAYHEQGLPVVSIEPPFIYGPRARMRLGMPLLAFKLRLVPRLGRGQGRIRPVYVTDVADLVAAADASEEAIGQRFLAPGPRLVTYQEILDRTAHTLGVRPFYLSIPLWSTVVGLRLYNFGLRLLGKDVFFSPNHFIEFNRGADYRPEKAEKLLGWRPKIDIETGLPKMIAWFLNKDK